MTLFHSPSVQSPKAYDLANLQGSQLITRFTRAQFYSKLADPFRVAADQFGLAHAASKATNAAALTNAIAAAVAGGGAVVELPPGDFAIDATTIVIPPNVVVRGAGNQQTLIRSDNTGAYAFALGSAAATGVNKYGCGLLDLQLLLTQTNGKALVCMETVGALVENLYFQGPIAASRSTKGVVIDGGNASAFFNSIRNVNCAHMHVGFDTLSTGTVIATCNTFVDIAASGDVGTDTTSVGFRIQGSIASMGNGTNVHGADMEQCQYSYYLQASTGVSAYYGARSEGSTKDIYFETGAGTTSWYGGNINIDGGSVQINSGTTMTPSTGSAGHAFIAVGSGSNTPNTSYYPGQGTFSGLAAGDVPVRIIPTAGDTTVAALEVKNTSGVVVFRVLANGKPSVINSLATQTVTGAKSGNLALASLVSALANLGIIVDGTT